MAQPFAVDLRSDTVTQPDEAMRKAMACAEVGDDVLEGDPTVCRLEELVATLLGKDAGLFVTSGTQGNLVALLSHGTFGRAVLAGRVMHVEQWEAGGSAVVGGAPLALLPETEAGLPDPTAVTSRCAVVDDPHVARVGLAWAENTHGGLGGLPVTADAMGAYRAAVPSHLPLHTDGARLLDAAVALGTAAATLVTDADSATLCLSKGIGCPVGTVLVGSRDLIAEARRFRKLVGGGMRQSGVLAAAGLHVLDDDGLPGTLEAIARSHELARQLSDALAELPHVSDPYDSAVTFDPTTTRTNIVRFGVADTLPGGRDTVIDALEGSGVGALRYGAGIRMVTHRRLTASDVDRAIGVLRGVLAACPPRCRRDGGSEAPGQPSETSAH
jgi:threonine aldolase